MFATTLKSFAKINIGLRVLSKRSDGYHNLETIFHPIKLHDEISIKIEPTTTGTNSVILKFNKPFIPLTKDNLCYKAVEHFFKEFRIKDCYKFDLDIRKNIPVGGGLGGGSSNAAALLKCLIKFFKIDVSANRTAILETALSIGSDVPFFLILKSCYAEGRGEKITVLREFWPDFYTLIVNPNLHVSTKWAFQKLNVSNDSDKELILNTVKKFDYHNSHLFTNDFEEIVFKKYSVLRDIKDDIKRRGAIYASMSGSGATMFGFFEKTNKEALKNCQEYYVKKNFFTYVSY